MREPNWGWLALGELHGLGVGLIWVSKLACLACGLLSCRLPNACHVNDQSGRLARHRYVLELQGQVCFQRDCLGIGT